MEKTSVNTVYKPFSYSPGFSLYVAPDFSSFSQAIGSLLYEKNYHKSWARDWVIVSWLG
jgi:hypothetical protein